MKGQKNLLFSCRCCFELDLVCWEGVIRQGLYRFVMDLRL